MFESLHIKGYLDDGAILQWSYISKPDHLAISYSLDGLTEWVTVSDNLSPDTSVFIVNKDILDGNTGAYIKISAMSSSDIILDDSTIYVDIKNVSGSVVVPTARNANGLAKVLKVDEGGNLMVSAITLDASGMGDASSAHQITQISSLNSISNQLSDIDASISSVETKLNSVSINSAQISDLKNINVDNFPAQYPDIDTTSAIQSLSSIAAKDTSIDSLISSVNLLPKKADFSFDLNNNIEASIKNLPTDYPDSAALNEAVNTNTLLSNGNIKIDDVNSSLTSIDNRLLTANDNLSNLHQTQEFIKNTALPSISSSIDSVNTAIDATNSKIATELTLSNIDNKVDLLIKTSDLPVVDNKIVSTVDNMPAEFTNTNVENSLTYIGGLTAQLVNNQGDLNPLPAGSNLIGKVENTNAILPSNAAKDTTLIAMQARLGEVLSEIEGSTVGSIKNKLDTLVSKIDTVISEISISTSSDPLYSNNIDIPARQKHTTAPIENSNRGELVIGTAFGETAATVKLVILTSENGVSFFPMKKYDSILIEGGLFHLINVPSSLKFIQLQLINTSSTLPISGMTLVVSNGDK